MYSIDKKKTQEMLDKTCKGWADSWTWDIVNTTIDREGDVDGTIEELEWLQTQLAKITNAMKSNWNEITEPEQE